MGPDETFELFAPADYECCAQLTRLTWLEWLPIRQGGVTRYVAVLPNAAAAQAAASTLSRYIHRAGVSIDGQASFVGRLRFVETTGPIVFPVGVTPGLVHAAVKEAAAATFLSVAISKLTKP